MGLEQYRRKRNFKKTPEPPPARVKRRTAQLSYLIQKHEATRLHYDFRLELDGVLLSWAVTKGPSLSPSDKRLAVRTEDHPLSYGTFEGTIPKGQYGGGTVMLWDEGTWEPTADPKAGLKKGHLAFTLHGKRLKGEWNLVRMGGESKKENWLLIKGKDQEARQKGASANFLEDHAVSVKSGRSMEDIAGGDSAEKTRSVAPSPTHVDKLMAKYPEVQLATLVDKAPDGPQWLHEIKFDGYRLLGFVSNGAPRLRTRNGKDWTERFPSLGRSLEKMKVRDAVLDIEAIVVDDSGKSSFQSLQAALGSGGNPEKIIAYAFDLLHLNGKDLRTLPLTERKEQLRAMLKSNKPNTTLRYSDHITGGGEEMLAKACSTGLEGIVSKRADAPYTAGRGKTWLKTKCAQGQEFIILGSSAARTGSRALGAIYLGYLRNGALTYAGKVGTGFSMKSAESLVKRFDKLAVKKALLSRDETGLPAGEWRSIRWIKPVLLCEVAFTEWTADGRIRHPYFQGLREDKDARQVKMEKPVPNSTRSATTVAKEKTGGLTLEGISITHPDRVISETGQITKGELAEYYAGVAPLLLSGIAGRPLSLLRCPAGIDGECFYQRNPGKGLGRNVRPFKFRHNGKTYEYLYIEDEKGLLEIVQMGAIEIHPWGSPVAAIDYPDRLIFDLDPAPDVPLKALKLAAEEVRQHLQAKGLESTLKCTGGKGLHVTVSLAGKDDWSLVKSFAASVAEEMVAAAPETYVATMSKAKRRGKIFIDYLRNDYTATAIADYAVRARPGLPVAVPLEWKELKSLKSPDQFSMKDVLARLKNRPPGLSSDRPRQTIPSKRS